VPRAFDRFRGTRSSRPAIVRGDGHSDGGLSDFESWQPLQLRLHDLL